MGDSIESERQIEAILFDMDGVIFDSEILYFEAGTALLARRGFTFTEELANRMRGIPGRIAIELLRTEHDLPEDAQSLFEESEVLFQSLLADRLQPMPGALELLSRVERRGLPKALATSTKRPLAEQMLKQFDLMGRFATILTSDDVTHGKPNPEIYLLACDRLNVAPAKAVVIEDSLAGSRAAKAAGCACILMPGEPYQSTKHDHVDLVVTHLLDDRLLRFCGL